MVALYVATASTIFLAICTVTICIFFVPSLLQSMSMIRHEISLDFNEFNVAFILKIEVFVP